MIDTDTQQITDMPHPICNLTGRRFGLLLGEMRCYHCHALTSVASLWIGDFQEIEDGEVIDEGDAALLTYVEWIDDNTAGLIRDRAPWIRFAPTKASGTTYWANHCAVCGTIQGDHYVHEVDGPFWPQCDADLAKLEFVSGQGEVRALGRTSQSSWMERVESVCRRG